MKKGDVEDGKLEIKTLIYIYIYICIYHLIYPLIWWKRCSCRQLSGVGSGYDDRPRSGPQGRAHLDGEQGPGQDGHRQRHEGLELHKGKGQNQQINRPEVKAPVLQGVK